MLLEQEPITFERTWLDKPDLASLVPNASFFDNIEPSSLRGVCPIKTGKLFHYSALCFVDLLQERRESNLGHPVAMESLEGQILLEAYERNTLVDDKQTLNRLQATMREFCRQNQISPDNKLRLVLNMRYSSQHQAARD